MLTDGSGDGWLALSLAPDMRRLKLARSFAGTTLLRIIAARLLGAGDGSVFGDCGSDGGPEEKASASIAGDGGPENRYGGSPAGHKVSQIPAAQDPHVIQLGGGVRGIATGASFSLKW